MAAVNSERSIRPLLFLSILATMYSSSSMFYSSENWSYAIFSYSTSMVPSLFLSRSRNIYEIFLRSYWLTLTKVKYDSIFDMKLLPRYINANLRNILTGFIPDLCSRTANSCLTLSPWTTCGSGPQMHWSSSQDPWSTFFSANQLHAC